MNQIPLYKPLESPLEELFAFNLEKYLDSSINLQNQIEVETICGNFRIDFVAYSKIKRIAFECDGADYHNVARDEWRDAMILGAKAVDVIYRLRGSDLTYHIEDCLYLISKWEPEIFSQRGKINLEILASKETKSWPINKSDTSVMITFYRQSRGNNNPLYIFIERRLLEMPAGQRSFWKALFKYAEERGSGNLDKIIEQYWKEKILNFE